MEYKYQEHKPISYLYVGCETKVRKICLWQKYRLLSMEIPWKIVHSVIKQTLFFHSLEEKTTN